MLTVDGENLLRTLGVSGPGARDLFDEGFPGSGGEGACVSGVAVLEAAEERHASAEGGGLVGEAGPLRDDGDPAAVKEFLRRHV